MKIDLYQTKYNRLTRYINKLIHYMSACDKDDKL